MKICFATNNENKIKEVVKVLEAGGSEIEIVSLKDIGCLEDIPETQPTIEGNASQKSAYVYEKYFSPLFSSLLVPHSNPLSQRSLHIP